MSAEPQRLSATQADGVTIRDLVPDDAGSFVDLLVAMEAYYAVVTTPRTTIASRVAMMFENAGAMTLLGASTHDGALAGFLSASRIFPCTGLRSGWFVKELYVDAPWRGQGIGRRLLRTFLARAEADGSERADITTDPQNIAAIGLYTSLGAVPINKTYLRYELAGHDGCADASQT